METERIEYLRKNGRKHGKKKGVLWCGIDPDNEDGVLVGFSLCHAIDDFDVISKGSNIDRYGNVKIITERVPGFGLNVARERGDKWRFHSAFFVQNSHNEEELEAAEDYEIPFELVSYENPDPANIVEIPPSIIDRLRTFLIRCKKYYKDKTFPEWADAVLQGDETSVYDPN